MSGTPQKETCCFCHLPRAELRCGACDDAICRKCVERLSEETFDYLATKPAELCHLNYCPRCHDSIIAPALERYNEILERARNVGFWTRTYKGHVPVISRSQEEITVENCRDRDDALMRLGFRAAEMGFNGMVRGELMSRKQRDHGYQKMLWSARATPCVVDEEKLEREEFREVHWRVLHHR